MLSFSDFRSDSPLILMCGFEVVLELFGLWPRLRAGQPCHVTCGALLKFPWVARFDWNSDVHPPAVAPLPCVVMSPFVPE